MKLSEALRYTRKSVPADAKPLDVFLACGFTPLHLATFLNAQLRLGAPERRVSVQTGLFGDLVGNLQRAERSGCDAVAVPLEWPDLDLRLGIRQPGDWSPLAAADILGATRDRLAQLGEVVAGVAAKISVAVSLPTLALPPLFASPGWAAGAEELGLHAALARFAAEIAETPNVHVLSAQRLAAESSWSERHDVRTELAAGFPYSLQHAAALAAHFAAALIPAAPRKGLITDLDDTLWRGLLGEVGVNGVHWDLDRGSQIHALYQQTLYSLAQAGVLIGIASKNDGSLVEEVFRRADLCLPREFVFPVQAHWQPKSTSVSAILKTWNIAEESVVFVDDSPFELAEVKAAHPRMECLPFHPQNEPAVYALLRTLRDLFGKRSVTMEDRLRLNSIRQSAVLVESGGAAAGTHEAILAGAGAVVSVSLDKAGAGGRPFELVNKTNQFNLNGRRYTLAEWKELLADADRFLMLVEYEDRFARLGQVAVISGRPLGKRLEIDTWVMSCRAFARRIEHLCMSIMFDRFGVREIALDLAMTPRNAPLREFLAEFSEVTGGRGCVISEHRFRRKCPALHQRVITREGIAHG